jgi:lipoate-protein ligase A
MDVADSSAAQYGLTERFAAIPVAQPADYRLGADLLAGHAAGTVPHALRFQRYRPSVLVGCHQVFAKEAREAWCAERGIAVVRRETAGGALYMDEGQQAFHLVVPSAKLGNSVSERLQKGAAILATALRSLGVPTTFKAPNDLQIDQRQKIGSLFLAETGNSTLLFGTVIVELDLKSAMQALLVPTEKLTVTGLEHARERMTSLAEQLGAAPQAAILQGAIAGAFVDALRLPVAITDGGITTLASPVTDNMSADWEPRTERFETKDKVPGATLRLNLGVMQGNVSDHVRFSTDGQFSPADSLARLGEQLTGLHLDSLATGARAFFQSELIDCAGFEPEDVTRLIERAVTKKLMQDELGLSPEQTSGVMLAGNSRSTSKTLEKASVMLVPYCAKPGWCKWRHTIDCVECGQCEVGDAYIMARERNMEVVTITNFEHLSDTLGKMKQAGVESYVGMCCGEFFLKRHHAFRDSGMDAVLLDIEGATCYELKEEHLAYAGAFKAEARLDIDAVGKVLAKVPARPATERPRFTGLARRPGERKYEAEENRKRCGSNCNCSAKPPAEAT